MRNRPDFRDSRDDARNDYSRQNNDSLGQSSRSGRGGSWSNRDDDDRMQGRSRPSRDNDPSRTGSDLYDRMERGGSHTSSYGDEFSSRADRYRNNPDRDEDRHSMRNSNDADMGADSWGAAADRDTGHDRYNSNRDDYYGNRSINEDDYGSGRSNQLKGQDDRTERGRGYDGESSSGRYGSRQYGGQSGRGGMQDDYNASSSGRGGMQNSSRNQWSSQDSSQRSYGSGQSNPNPNRGRDDSYGGISNSDRAMERDRGQSNYGDRYTGREGGSNQFSSWQHGPSDMQNRNDSATQRGQHAGRGPKGYRRDDNRITEDVNEALTRDHHIDASDIEVKVSNGEVTLTGTVDSRDAKRHAEDIAESVSGVSEVTNQIRVSKNNWRASSTDDSSDEQADGSLKSASSGNRAPTDKGTDKASSKSASTPTPDAAMSHAAGTGPSGASSTSVTANNPSGKTSPNTSGASTQRAGDRSGSQG